MADVTWSGKADNLKPGAKKGMKAAAEYLLEKSNEKVPLEYGDLQRSGVASVEDTDDGAVAAVSYGTVYAIPQHERLDYKHPNGRQAKYLEKAASENKAMLLKLIGQGIQEALGLG